MRKQVTVVSTVLAMVLTLSLPLAVPTWANTAPVKQQPGQSIAPKPPVTVPSTAPPSSPAFYVNGNDVTKQGVPTYRAGVLYLPLESVVIGMGDSFTWVTMPRVANVKTKSGKEVTVTIAKADVVVDGKNVPVSTLQLQGTSVPMQAKPVVVNDMLYVPHDFFKDVMGYPVEVKKNDSTEAVYVGTGPTPTILLTPTSEIKEDPHYPFPPGWTPPQLSSSWTTDKQKNMQILSDELGFANLGAGAVYSPYGKGATAIGLSASDLEKYDTSIQIDVWMGSEYTPLDHKIPYIAKALFRFYFSEDGDKLWKITDDAFNGKNVSQYLNKMLTYKNRQVKLMNVKGSLVIIVGKPGVKYDKDWKVVGTTGLTTPLSPAIKQDPRYPFPAGWTPDQIKSTWTSDKQKNMQIMADELGFANLGAGAAYSPYGKGPGTEAILISANDRQYDAMITIKYWHGDSYTPLAHKVPYVAKEMFRFYFPKDGSKIWQIADDAFNGKSVDQYLNKILTYETRQVKMMNVQGSLVIIVGKPGVKYDKDWNVIK